MRPIRALVALAATTACVLTAAPSAAGASQPHPAWHLIDSTTTNHFRGLAAVSATIAWLGGYDGQVLRTVDGGAHWKDVSPAGAETLQFRDISAFDAKNAVAMAAGVGTDSQLWVTSDGGAHWGRAYQNTNPAAFFDCMSFFDRRHGLVLSDPVGGKFRVLATKDGGQSWRVLSNAGMPQALTGEAGFAASGECLTTSGTDAWFVSGGGAKARVFRSRDGGHTWTVRNTPLGSGPSSGAFGIAFQGSLGIVTGGDFAAPFGDTDVAAYSSFADPWQTARAEPSGYRSGVTFTARYATAVAVGLTGSDVTYDAGRHWSTFDTGQFDTVSCARDGACWASGDLGRVATLLWRG